MSSALAFELTADTVGFDAAFKRAANTALRFGNKVSADLKTLVASAASYEAWKGFTRHTVEAMTSVKDFSEQANISTSDVQKLQAAAGKVGLSFDNVQAGLAKFSTARKDAVESNKDLLATFNRYGITLRELNDPQVRNIDLLKKLAGALDGVSLSDADRSRLSEMFGIKQGDKLIAVLNELAHLGPIKIFEQRDIEAVDRMVKDLENLKRSLTALFGPAIGGFAQSVTAGVAGKGTTPTEDIFAKLLQGELPSFDELVRRLGEAAGGPGLNTLISTGRLYEAFKGMFFADGSALPMGVPKKLWPGGESGGQETPLGEQWRQFYDYLDKEAELAQKIRKINFDMLSPKEQQIELQERINERLERAAELERQGLLRESISAKADALALNEQLLSLNEASPFRTRSADAATAAGAFIGGAMNFNPAAGSYGRDQTDLLRQVRDNTTKLVEASQRPNPPAASIYDEF